MEFKPGEDEPQTLTFNKAVYQEWFKVVVGDNSSPECIIDDSKYSLYAEAAGGDALVADPTASFGTNQIVANNPATEEGKTLYFQA